MEVKARVAEENFFRKKTFGWYRVNFNSALRNKCILLLRKIICILLLLLLGCTRTMSDYRLTAWQRVGGAGWDSSDNYKSLMVVEVCSLGRMIDS